MKKGFTLVELMVVVAIIALLSVGSFIYFGGYMKDARNGVRQSDLGQIMTALESKYAKDGKYPIYNPGVVFNLENVPEMANYIQKWPTDPKSATILYRYGTDLNGEKYEVSAILENADGTCTYLVKGNTNGQEGYSGDGIKDGATTTCP